MSMLGLLLAAAIGTAANAGSHPDEVEPRIVLSDAELASLRGGFAWNGVTIQLGAEIRSYLDDVLVMRTNVSWSPAGMQTTRFVADALEPAAAAALRNNLVAGASVEFETGGDAVFFANGGRTAFAHRTDGALQNVVLNAAGNIALRQEVDVQIDLDDMGAFQASAMAERVGASLAEMISQPLLGGQ